MYVNPRVDVLVSVIVPAYNVERYISKCIDSILTQSYNNIELIVVNDGSSDNTANIIEECISGDERASVLHIKNGGVSNARNVGITASSGKYIVFVDGDDYIASDCIEYMLTIVGFGEGDFGLSKCCYVKKSEQQTQQELKESLSSEEAIALLLSPEVVVGCWNKIYKRDLLIDNELWFSKSLFYGEGLTFIIEVADKANNIFLGNRKVYHYRKNNEDSATTKFDIEKIYNGEKALLAIENKLDTNSKLVGTMFKYHLSLYRLAALVKLRSNGLRNEYQSSYNFWLKYVRGNAFTFVLFNKLSLYRKLLLIGGAVSPWLVMKLDEVRRNNIIKNSVND
ncbi:glycosyltransferase [Vibrio harveyi]|uniref:glycosyltransferase family 2 protein n=1 Tax=Vibrio harveyi TaxID=669 RepID=UPI0036F1BA00